MQTLQAIKLHGPTILSQIIEEAINFASSEKVDQNNQKYSVLILLTDGSLNDMQSTVDLLYRAQHVPLSIVIVGIGQDDFSQIRMQIYQIYQILFFVKSLDADDSHLYSKTHKQMINRNIVQFLQYNKHRSNIESLTKEVLSQIPKQFLEFMESNHIFPQKLKKNNKAASSEFVHSKIEEARKLKKRESIIAGKIPQFLAQRKEDFIRQLFHLGYHESYVKKIIHDGVPSMDINLIIELISEQQRIDKMSIVPNTLINKVNFRNDIDPTILRKLKNEQLQVGHRIFRTQQRNKLDELLQLKKTESHLITKQFLSNLESNKVFPHKRSNNHINNNQQIQTPAQQLASFISVTIEKDNNNNQINISPPTNINKQFVNTNQSQFDKSIGLPQSEITISTTNYVQQYFNYQQYPKKDYREILNIQKLTSLLQTCSLKSRINSIQPHRKSMP